MRKLVILAAMAFLVFSYTNTSVVMAHHDSKTMTKAHCDDANLKLYLTKNCSKSTSCVWGKDGQCGPGQKTHCRHAHFKKLSNSVISETVCCKGKGMTDAQIGACLPKKQGCKVSTGC